MRRSSVHRRVPVSRNCIKTISGFGLLNEMLDKVGPELTFEIEDCVQQFCRAYGYDAHFLRWTEIQALWAEGVKGYETSRIKGSVGIR